jgi:uncharacterized protein YndB with AHSA1/START domain
MVFPDGDELTMNFVFLEVEKPARLVWKSANDVRAEDSRPQPVITVTLEDLGARTAWTMVARFRSLAERDGAIRAGFRKPIEGSSDRLVDYLKETLKEGGSK